MTGSTFMINQYIIACGAAFILFGCTSAPTTPPTTDSSTLKTHTFAAGNSKKLTFKSAGCKIGDGTLKNEANFASAGSYGTLLVANSQSRATIDEYRVSCAAVSAGATSSCVIQRVAGSGRDKDYGGANCPDMKFELTNFRSF